VGVLLLAVSVGSLSALPLAGAVVQRAGPTRTVVVCGVIACVGLAVVGASPALAGVVVGFVAFGAASGTWDVAMNVEGADVERRLKRSIMPRFHAAWSLGSVAGAGVGALAAAAGIPLRVHLPLVALLVLGVLLPATRYFLPGAEAEAAGGGATGTAQGSPERSRSRTAWRERRTVLLGVLVLCMTLSEGSANDWLALGLVDGYRVPPAAGAVGYAVFTAAMTLTRLAGPALLDRRGRVVALRIGSGLVVLGIGGFALGSRFAGTWSLYAAALACALLWGAGAALAFPVGISAAADDASRAAARVSVVATLGYTAFLAGPPLFGRLGNTVGVAAALAAVLLPVMAAFGLAGVARPLPGAVGADGTGADTAAPDGGRGG
jgi:MFS family permease